MGCVGVLLRIVHDQMAVGAEEVGAAPFVVQHLFVKKADPQAEIDQGLGQTVCPILPADTGRGVQHIEPGRHLLARGHAQFQPLVGFFNREAVERGFVQIVQHLADHPARFQPDGVELSPLEGRAYKALHVVLGGLQIEESRLFAGVPETGLGCNQRPVEFRRGASQTGVGGDAYRRAGGNLRAAQLFGVGAAQAALGNQHQNVVAPDALLAQQPADAGQGRARLARAKRAGQIETVARADCIGQGAIFDGGSVGWGH